MSCDSCEVVMLSGPGGRMVRCHEQGCPDAWKDREIACDWCGTMFKRESKGQTCCSHGCQVSWSNADCACEECAVEGGAS